MQKYVLTYDWANQSTTRHGEASECIDAHDLLIEVLVAEGKPGRIIGTQSSQESLSLMRFTNVRITWL